MSAEDPEVFTIPAASTEDLIDSYIDALVEIREVVEVSHNVIEYVMPILQARGVTLETLQDIIRTNYDEREAVMLICLMPKGDPAPATEPASGYSSHIAPGSCSSSEC